MESIPKQNPTGNPNTGVCPTPEEVVARLTEFRARRGYVNPQQGVMAAALPGVADGYRVMYKALVLDEKHLAPLEKEFVWLVLLCAAGELGKHHINLFYKYGGTKIQVTAAFRLAAWAAGVRTFVFLDQSWQPYFPEVDARRTYLDGVDTLIAGLADEVPPEWARLALLCSHSAMKATWGIEAELEACYAQGVAEVKMAEAMSLAMWPCGANCFHDAADVWLALIRNGRVQASAPFKAWADIPGQDGLDLDPQALA
jgi:hypothetical protein